MLLGGGDERLSLIEREWHGRKPGHARGPRRPAGPSLTQDSREEPCLFDEQHLRVLRQRPVLVPTIRSSRSAMSRTASIAGRTSVCDVLGLVDDASPSSGWSRLAASSAKIATTNSSIRPPSSSLRRCTPAPVPAALSVAYHWTAAEQHRARDRRRRLALDVERDHVLLDQHLVARLELALGQHLVLGQHLDGAGPISHGRASGVGAGSGARGARPPRATPRRSCRR